MIDKLVKKLQKLKLENTPKDFLNLALLNVAVGNFEVSKLYLSEYMRLSGDSGEIIVSPCILQAIIDYKYHSKWMNYRRNRSQSEKKKFTVVASLCTGDVLEIGCGSGDLSSYISMYGNRVFGIDIDPVAVEIARFKVWHFGLSDCFFDVIDANTNDIPIPDSSFDTVVLAEVLEHVKDPLKVLMEAKRLCKSGGKIIVSVPNGYRILSPDYLHIFNLDVLKELLSEIGVNEDDINWDDRVPDEWILCWFNNKEDIKEKKGEDLAKYFLPPHPLEDLKDAGKVSIILPTYNGEKYIQESIDSILNQTYKNFEIIVVNDGSTDKTYEKLKPYIERGQIKYISQENKGKPCAINTALEFATGDYIWIFDDDDTALPRKLEVQMRHLIRKPHLDLIHTSSIYTDSSNTIPLLVWEPSEIEQNDLLKSLLHGCIFHGSTVLVKKEAFLKTGKYDERLIRAQDYDMWIRLVKNQCNVEKIFLPTVTYRQHNKVRGSKENPIPVEKIAEVTMEYERIIFEKVYNEIPLSEIFPELKEENCNSGLRVSALIERAYAMAKRRLFDYALNDLKEAFELAQKHYPVTITFRGIYFIKKFSEILTHIENEEIKNMVTYFSLLIGNYDVRNFGKKGKITLSLCLITKDEEKNIARCINSVKDIVDEIVVVDTGSKDKTVEIAQSLGAKVIHAKWEDDYSKARNIAIENATSDWILFLDADEEIKKEDVGKIQPLLNDDTVEAYMFKIVNYGGASVSNNLTEVHYNFRLFRNNGKLKYIYPIHENLRNVEENRPPIFKNADVTILHYGYLSEVRAEKNKTKRYINMLLQYLMKHPEDKFQHGNLGVEYYNAGDYKKALKHLITAVKGIDLNSFSAPRLLRYLIQTYTILKDYDTALKLINDAKAYYQDIPDFKFLEGMLYIEQKRYKKAIEMFKECIEMGEYQGLHVTMGGTGSYRARHMIAYCYERLGKLHDAVREYIEILKTYPNYRDVFIKLFDIFVRNEKPESVKGFFNKYVDQKNPYNFAILAKLYMNVGRFDVAKEYLDEIKMDIAGLNTLKGIVYLGLKDYNRAMEFFESEHEKAKNDSIYHKILCCLVMNDIENAKKALWELEDSADKKLFLTIFGEFKAAYDEVKDSYFGLLEKLISFGEFDLFNEILKLYTPLFTREDYVRYGRMMESKSFYEPAITAYIKAADLYAEDPHIYRFLAERALEQNLFDDALIFAARAFNLDRRDVDNYTLMYKIYKNMGRNDEAEGVKKSIKEIYPEIDLEELV
ncbi:Tetratricopeptide repeat-containing protein [Caldanaerovirga acetigignens]|uniref:Tetratricopeptide repeat-containing protein n=1 Tax=Caldanaerovirga acetigignens TaxID=447595 RepID=A0A1M7ICX7_9FIRM|nr:glycosyltransferase [Caldanaerovirga acetigignens]SHM38307.1 Tetratricopeptide repeat-containing protein [Caldanaerovirga acetigignens]